MPLWLLLLLLLRPRVTHDSGQQIDLIRESAAESPRGTPTVDYLVTGATPRHAAEINASPAVRFGSVVLISVSRPANLL